MTHNIRRFGKSDIPVWVVGVICMRNAKYEWVRSVQLLGDVGSTSWYDDPRDATKFNAEDAALEAARVVQADDVVKIPMLTEGIVVFPLDCLNEVRTQMCSPLGANL